MQKKRKKVLAQFVCVLLLLASVVPARAAQPQMEISPLYAEPIVCALSANISATNVLIAEPEYTVNNLQTVTSVTIRTYVEKRSLLVIWNTVDIGEANDEWVDYGGTETFIASHTVQLPSSGTYRVTSVFEVYGGSTLIDTIEVTKTVSC